MGKLGTTVIALMSFALICLAFSTAWWPFGAEIIARSLAGAAAFAGFIAVIILLDRRNQRAEAKAHTRRSGSKADGIDLAWLFERQRAALDTENLESIPAFIQLLVDPGSYRTRTIEEVSLRGRVIEQRVSVLFGKLPACNGDEAYVPVLTPRKGELIDNLALQNGDGANLSALCHTETMKLVQLALHFLITACLTEISPADADADADSDSIWTADASKAEALFLEIIFGEVVEEAAIKTKIGRAFEWLNTVSVSAGPGISNNATWLREFVTQLSTAYPIVISVPIKTRNGRHLVMYSRTVIPSPRVVGFRDRLRLALGLRPLRVGISPLLAYTSKSYHLWIKAPDSQFIMEQALRCRNCGKVLNRHGQINGPCKNPHSHSKPSGDAYCQLQEPHGQNYVHLYMRGFQQSKRANLELMSSFGEVPPGTLGSAAMTAGMAVLLIGTVGHTVIAKGAVDSNLPALLLALPAAAASWFGFTSDSEAVLRSSLAGRCSLMVGGLVSLAAAGIYVLGVGTAHRPSMRTLGMPLPSWWSVLFLLAAANTLYVFMQLAVRSRIYRRLLLRGELDADHTLG